MRKTIALDLDGVITDIAGGLEKRLTRDARKGINYTDWLTTDTKDDYALSIFGDEVFWKNLHPFMDAWYQVNNWFAQGVDVNIITARRLPASKKTAQPWLDDWRINTLIPKFAMIHEKYEIVKDLNPVFMVEDNPNEVRILREHGVNCYLRKAEYNKKYWNELPTIDTLFDLEI